MYCTKPCSTKVGFLPNPRARGGLWCRLRLPICLRRPCGARPAPPSTTLSPPTTAYRHPPAAPSFREQLSRRSAHALRELRNPAPWWAAARGACAPPLRISRSHPRLGPVALHERALALPCPIAPDCRRLPPMRPPAPGRRTARPPLAQPSGAPAGPSRARAAAAPAAATTNPPAAIHPPAAPSARHRHPLRAQPPATLPLRDKLTHDRFPPQSNSGSLPRPGLG